MLQLHGHEVLKVANLAILPSTSANEAGEWKLVVFCLLVFTHRCTTIARLCLRIPTL